MTETPEEGPKELIDKYLNLQWCIDHCLIPITFDDTTRTLSLKRSDPKLIPNVKTFLLKRLQGKVSDILLEVENYNIILLALGSCESEKVTNKAIGNSQHNPVENSYLEPVNLLHDKAKGEISGYTRKRDQQPLAKMSANEASEIITYAQIGVSFQVNEVIQRIIETEMSRIQAEKNSWRVIGGIAGAALSLSDGFDPGDIFTSIAFSNIGSMAHSFASQDQIEFLQKINSDWLFSKNSAIEILHRLGMPKMRVVSYFAAQGTVTIANYHENPARGSFLIRLGPARENALGFKIQESAAILHRSFTIDEISQLSNQLYPSSIIAVEGTRRISHSKAKELNPYHDLLGAQSEPYLHTDTVSRQNVISYKIPIPLDSEY